MRTVGRERAAGRGSLCGSSSLISLLIALAALVSGCVPIPYKPAATVSHEPLEASEAQAITLTSGRNSAARPASVAKAIQHDETRIVLVDGAQTLTAVLGADRGTLAELVDSGRSAAGPAFSADYLLCVGEPENEKLHGNGDVVALGFVVGYEKLQFRSVLPASLVDLRGSETPDRLLATSTYNDVVAGVFYGFALIARSQAALEDALAADVAHRLAAAHPTGPIRLAVVAQRGSAMTGVLPVP